MHTCYTQQNYFIAIRLEGVTSRSGGVSTSGMSTQICMSMATLSVLLTLLAVTLAQKCTELMLYFHGSSGYMNVSQCSMCINNLLFFFRIMACFTSLLVREAEIPFKTSPFMSVASMATGIITNDVSPTFYNRNPRNLERLRIAYKPSGYHLEAPGREFWHKYVYRKYIGYSESSHTVHAAQLWSHVMAAWC